jgi:hypothetical protein
MDGTAATGDFAKDTFQIGNKDIPGTQFGVAYDLSSDREYLYSSLAEHNWLRLLKLIYRSNSWTRLPER